MTDKVALVYTQPMPKQIELGKKIYNFDCKHGISLAWVDPEDVPALLAMKGGCCGRNSPLCNYANENQIKMHEFGNYR